LASNPPLPLLSRHPPLRRTLGAALLDRHPPHFSAAVYWIGTFAFDPNTGAGIDYTTVFKRGSLVTYAGPDTATLHKADYSSHYDHFVIQADQDSDEQEQE
jgi:hypothetical protein